MKIIKSQSYVNQIIESKAGTFDPETLADAILQEMETNASRAIAREKAKENLSKDLQYYKKSCLINSL